MVRTTGLLLLISALIIAVAALSLGGGIHPTSAEVVPLSHDGNWFNGDANCDQRIDGLDALAVLQLEAGLLDTLVFPAGGDSNRDGKVNSMDALLILQFHAGFMPDLDADICIPLLFS